MTIRAAILATEAGTLEGYWPCDDASGNLLDSSGNSRDLIMFGTNTYGATGTEGDAVTFNGTSGHAYREDSVIGAAPTAMTVFGYVNGNTVDDTLFSFGSSTSVNPMIQVYLTAAGLLTVFVRNEAATTRLNITDLGDIQDGTWHSFALSHDGTDYRTYLDGVLVDTTTAVFDLTSLNRTAIGALLRATPSGYYAGSAQHVAVWSSALTTQQILDIHDGSVAFAPPAITDLPGSPSPRYFADPRQVEFNGVDATLIDTWGDGSADSNNAVGGDATYGQSKATMAYDVDGFAGVFINKDVDYPGFGIPAAVSGQSSTSAAMVCVTPLYERTGTITRFLAAAGVRVEWFSDVSTTSNRSPRMSFQIVNDLTTSMRRQVLGYRRVGTDLQVFYNGEVYTFAGSTITDSTDSGGYLGTSSANTTSRFYGLIHDVAMYRAVSAGNVVSETDWLAAGDAMMDLWDVSEKLESDYFVQCVGDSMANGADGTASSPYGWADLIRPPYDGYEYYIEAVPGWDTAGALAVFADTQGRKTTHGKRNNIAVILIGTNDVGAADAATHAANITSLWQTYKTEGFTVIGGTVPPRGDAAGAYLTRMRDVNVILRASPIADYFIDAERELPVLMGTTVDPSSHPLWNVDAVHPSTTEGYPIYARFMARRVNEIIRSMTGDQVQIATDAAAAKTAAVSANNKLTQVTRGTIS